MSSWFTVATVRWSSHAKDRVTSGGESRLKGSGQNASVEAALGYFHDEGIDPRKQFPAPHARLAARNRRVSGEAAWRPRRMS
jgi:hypothetical protein